MGMRVWLQLGISFKLNGQERLSVCWSSGARSERWGGGERGAFKRGDPQMERPGVGMNLMHLKNRKKAHRAGAEEAGEIAVQDEVDEGNVMVMRLAFFFFLVQWKTIDVFKQVCEKIWWTLKSCFLKQYAKSNSSSPFFSLCLAIPSSYLHPFVSSQWSIHQGPAQIGQDDRPQHAFALCSHYTCMHFCPNTQHPPCCGRDGMPVSLARLNFSGFLLIFKSPVPKKMLAPRRCWMCAWVFHCQYRAALAESGNWEPTKC